MALGARDVAARIPLPPLEAKPLAHRRWPCRLQLVLRRFHLRFLCFLQLLQRTSSRSRASLVRTSSLPCSSLGAPERCRHRCFVIPMLPKPFCRRCLVPTRHSPLEDHWRLFLVHWHQDQPLLQCPWASRVPHHRPMCRRHHHQSWHRRHQYQLFRKVAHGQA